ncbi:MAG: efflux RND transporter permease subunit, partial [Bacilli bacterium]|nr:efflux RND transporter permease subunit [Bacilli bacterium]
QVTLGDLGTIELQDTSSKIYEFNGEKAVFLSLYFKADVDFTKMGDDVLAIKNTFLVDENNSSLSISEMLFLPDYVNEQINNVFMSLLICIAVVMVVVLMGIGLRNSILIIITIPLIIFATIGVLNLTGYELHKLTIVGLIVAIGILVDNSIVITEGIKRNLDDGLERIASAKKAIHDNSIPVLSSTLTTIAAFVVLVMLPGFLGEIVASMPLTVIIAISLSYVVSITLSPVLATIFLKEGKKEKKPTASIHEINIKKMIAFTTKFPLIWITISILLLVGSVYFAFQKQSLDLYPNDERSVLYIDFNNDVLGDLESTTILEEQIIDTFIDNENVINYASSIGGNLPSFHFSASRINERNHIGRIYINFDYSEEDLLQYKKELETKLSFIEGAKITVNILELSPPLAPVRLTLRSDDLAKLDQLSFEIFAQVSELPNVKSFNITESVHSLKYNIIYDMDEISNHFLTKAQIDQIIALNLNGLDLNIFNLNDKTINISINSDISLIDDVLLLQVYSEPLDQNFTLDNFISIESINDYSIINRLNNLGTSHIDLYFTDDSSLTELESNVKDVVSQYELGSVIVDYNGENQMFEEISGDLIRASIIALIIIYIIMFIQFNNFIKPLIVYLTIPLSFSGSFLFLIIFNSPITATSLVGMVSLIGVTVNTGILLVEYISRNHHNGDDIKKACVDAVYLRFRPIMLTSLTTILGLIPLLITGGNFFKPLAITFMGGMVTSTLLTIFLVPSVYYMIYHKKPKKKNKKSLVS